MWPVCVCLCVPWSCDLFVFVFVFHDHVTCLCLSLCSMITWPVCVCLCVPWSCDLFVFVFVFHRFGNNLNQSWLPAFCEQIPNTQEIKRAPFHWTNRTKPAHFRGSPLFPVTYNVKQKEIIIPINPTYLVSVGCWRLAEGKRHETDWCDKEKGVTQ